MRAGRSLRGKKMGWLGSAVVIQGRDKREPAMLTSHGSGLARQPPGPARRRARIVRAAVVRRAGRRGSGCVSEAGGSARAAGQPGGLAVPCRPQRGHRGGSGSPAAKALRDGRGVLGSSLPVPGTPYLFFRSCRVEVWAVV